MKAIELLNRHKERVVRCKYNNKIWSGIRASSTRNGEVRAIELSRWEGEIGNITAETCAVTPDTDVTLVKTS